MTIPQIQALLREIEYKDWHIAALRDPAFGYLQVRFDPGIDGPQYGRKWRLSRHMTRSEVVQTALLEIADARHDARNVHGFALT